MAWRFCARAESETSAHTGRLTSLQGLFCVRAMDLPNKLVYDIQSPQAGGHTGCRVKDNSCQNCMRSATNWNVVPFADGGSKTHLKPAFTSASSADGRGAWWSLASMRCEACGYPTALWQQLHVVGIEL